MRTVGFMSLLLLSLATPVVVAEDEATAVAATPIAYEDVYRGYLGMDEAVIAGIPAYESAYGLNDDDCLSIAIIAHAASVPFHRAIEDYCGPCHRSLSELMRRYSVPPETLYVDVPRASYYPVVYERLYEPYWDGHPVYVVSNADCHALFAFRVSCEFRHCPPPVFFQRVDVYGSPVVAFHRQRAWWPVEHPPGFAPLPPRELTRPGRVIAETRVRAPSASGAAHGSNSGVDPSRADSRTMTSLAPLTARQATPAPSTGASTSIPPRVPRQQAAPRQVAPSAPSSTIPDRSQPARTQTPRSSSRAPTTATSPTSRPSTATTPPLVRSRPAPAPAPAPSASHSPSALHAPSVSAPAASRPSPSPPASTPSISRPSPVPGATPSTSSSAPGHHRLDRDAR
jgi:hypothetical protein